LNSYYMTIVISNPRRLDFGIFCKSTKLNNRI
jgi:hypothetical protein